MKSDCLKNLCSVSPTDQLVNLLFYLTELFDNYMQQDAHEFLNYLLNTIADILQEERKQEKQNGRLPNGSVDSENNSPPDPTWVHEIFQGTLTNETRCLTCETVSLRVLCKQILPCFRTSRFMIHSSQQTKILD